MALNDLWSLDATMYAEVAERLKDAQAAVDRGATPKKPPQLAMANTAGIQSIRIQGPLVKYATAASAWAGYSDYQSIMAAIDSAIESPNVMHIVLQIDSPGGEARGVNQVWEKIKWSPKPITAVVDGYCTSAAYYIASAAQKIIATRDSLIGSIGTMYTHVEYSAALDKQGVKITEFTTGPLKGVGSPYRPMTDLEKQTIQSMLNTTSQQFTHCVQVGRASRLKCDISYLATGMVWFAKEAQSCGLIDGVGFPADVLAELTASHADQWKSQTTTQPPTPVRGAAPLATSRK